MPKSDTEIVSDLIGKIYDAAVNSTQWRTVLADLTSVLNGTAAVIRLFNKETLAPVFSAEIGHDDFYINAYHNYYYMLDPINSCQDKLQVGVLLDTRKIINDRDFKASEFYNDFVRRYDLFYGVGANVAEVDDGCLRLGIQRSQQMGAFGVREKRLILQLTPHFQRALKIHYRFSALERERNLTYEAMNRLTLGVILLDEEARPFFINSSADNIITKNNILLLSSSGARARYPSLDKSLQKAINECLLIAKGDTKNGNVHPFVFNNESGGSSLKLIVAPLFQAHGETSFGLARPCIALYIFNTESLNVHSHELLSAIYELTPAESRLAIALGNGDSLDEIAGQFNIAKTTARAHLRSIFEKTNTHRQGEVVRLVINTVGSLN
jgi:DNA-binding CsgD family transcriptional regulator